MKDFEEIAREQADENGQKKTILKKPPLIVIVLGILLAIYLVGILASCGSNEDKEPSTTLSPVELEEKENSYIRTATQETIKRILKTPKSADFPVLDEWKFEVGDVSFYKIAHAYVDYENVFGTEVRSYFDVTVKITEEGYQAVRIVFDGETIYEDKITIASDIAEEENYEETQDGEQ